MGKKSDWIERFYDPIAKSYDNCRQALGNDSGIIFKLVESYLPRMRRKRILDIGCGTGLSAAPFAKKGWQIFGIDGSKEMLKIFARKGFARFLRVVDVEKERFPFWNGYFDLVISNRTFRYLPDLDNAISEAGRVLQSGGIFCFTVDDVRHTEPSKFQNAYRHKLEYLTAVLQKANFDLPVSCDYADYRSLTDSSPAIFTALLCRKK